METENWQDELRLSFALAHIGMLAQAAAGSYRATPEEVEERSAWLIGYIRDGTGLVTPENKVVLEKINSLLREENAVSCAA